MKKNAFIIASYKEYETLPLLLLELVAFLNEDDVVVIADDSPVEDRYLFETRCRKILEDKSIDYLLSFSDEKGGRGMAVRRGMELSLKKFPELMYLFEMDADSSHQPQDIKALKYSQSNADLIIGSRYMSDSKIIGWPLTRRIFSKMLNLLIPRIFDLKINDVTNGLRKYKTGAAKYFLHQTPVNSGFIYLTEQVLILKSNDCTFDEIPTTFVNRTVGKSTVTYKEVFLSLFGIFNLFKSGISKSE